MIVNKLPHICKLFKDKVVFFLILSVQKLDKDISRFRAIGLSNEVTVAYCHKVISSIYFTYCYSRRLSIASNIREFILKLDSCRGGRG